MLKGLSKIYFNDEYKEKLIVVLMNLKDKDESFNSELKFHIDDAIKIIKRLIRFICIRQ